MHKGRQPGRPGSGIVGCGEWSVGNLPRGWRDGIGVWLYSVKQAATEAF